VQDQKDQPAPNKPIDRWLGIGGIAVGIAFFLLPKTPLVVALCGLIMFGLVLHPIVNFWWVEKTRTRQAAAIFGWALTCFVIGWSAWPTTAPTLPVTAKDIVDEIERRSKPTEKPSVDQPEVPIQPKLEALPTKPKRSLAPTVTISPTQVILRLPGSDPQPDTLSETYTFRISNTTAQDVYMVSFKFRAMTDKINPTALYFGVPKSSRKPLVDTEDTVGSRFSDIAGVDCLDQSRRPVLVRLIVKLGPHESREVLIGLKNVSAAGQRRQGELLPKKVNPPTGENFVLRAQVYHHTVEPQPLLQTGNMRMAKFFVDENLQCDQMPLVLLK